MFDLASESDSRSDPIPTTCGVLAVRTPDPTSLHEVGAAIRRSVTLSGRGNPPKPYIGSKRSRLIFAKS